MEIEHQYGTNSGKFTAKSGKGSQGEMDYSLETSILMSIDHTMVAPASRGNDIGLQLLDCAVAYARKNEIHIRPACTFVQAMFKKYAAKYEDVILK